MKHEHRKHNKETKKNIEYKKKKKALRKLKGLLIRVWFFKNWFTIFTVIATILMVSTITGIIPETIPFIGTFSNAIKVRFQHFLEIDDSNYMSLFGAVSGIFSVFFALGYTSSNIKSVSYSMINKKKLGNILMDANLSITDKGRIIKAEEKLGLDLDGDNKIGNTPMEIINKDTIIGDIVSTFTELSTILSVDEELLKEINKEQGAEKKKDDSVDVVSKKPATKYRPPGF